MAGRIGHTTGQVVSGSSNPYLSSDLDELDELVASYDDYNWRTTLFTGPITVKRVHQPNRRGIVGSVSNSFRQDFYGRVHVFPSRISLGTVASEQARQVSLWNAYTTQNANLDHITITNGGGIILTGPGTPLVMTPLQELLYNVRITADGSPQINASILFDFSNVPDPLPLIITGTRAALLPVVPEVPVRERWEWLTDLHVTVDGGEQRIGLRPVPRRGLSTQLVFVNQAELREQYRVLLSAIGRLFVPYFQYATAITANALPGDSAIFFDVGLADVRDGDFVIVMQPEGARLLELAVVGDAGATLAAPLTAGIAKGAVIAPTFPSVIPNSINLRRAAVNEYGSVNISSEAIYPRSSLQRPGSVAQLTMFDGMPVLERRPLANNDIGHSFDTGQKMDDAKTGLVDLYSYWDFTKVEQGYEFLVRRVGRSCGWVSGVEEFDYWRAFCDEICGSLNPFLMSSYRPDQVLYSTVGVGADSVVVFGPDYVDNYWPAAAYHYISLTTPKGKHYAKVTAADKDAGGNSVLNFAPALPSEAGWNDITEISYLLKLRLANDEIELEHYPFDTIFKLQVRTVKE